MLVVSIEFLKMAKCSSRIEALWTSERTKTDLIAFAKFHVSTEFLKSFISVLIPGVNNPSIGLHKDSWPEIVLWMPPIRRTGRLATSAENTFVKTIEQFSVFNSLEIFSFTLDLFVLSLEEWVDRFVLGVEMTHVSDKVLKNKHEHQR